MWTPRKESKVTLYFEIDGVNRWSDAGRKATGHVIKDLGFSSAKSDASIELIVNSPKLPKLIERLPDALRAHKATLKWSVSEPPPPVPEKDGWFTPMMGGAEADNALKLRKDVHLGYIRLGEDCRYSHAYAASDQFLAALRDHKLTGLESLPLPPAGKKPQAGWSQVFATHPMGRGLDHPAADSAAVDAEYAVDKSWTTARRFGYSQPSGIMLSPSRVGHPGLRELLRLGEGTIHGHNRYVLEHAPDTDFAYTDWGTSDGGKGPHRGRSILVTRRARDVMIKTGLVKPARFDPVHAVPAADAGNIILDRTISTPVPPPSYTPAEATVERARRDAMLLGLSAGHPRSKLKSLDQAKRELTRAAKSAGAPLFRDTPALFSRFEKSALKAELPAAWISLAPFVPARLHDPEDPRAERWMAQAPARPSFTADRELKDRPPSDQPSRKDIVIGTTAYGDWYAIRPTDPGMPEDAAVRLWSHESLQIEMSWGSILEFAGYLVQLASAEAD